VARGAEGDGGRLLRCGSGGGLGSRGVGHVTKDDEKWTKLHHCALSRLRRRRRLSVVGLASQQNTYRTRGVYHWCMARVRTNIEIDDVYVRRIMNRYGIHTKTEAVDLALRHLAGQPMTREEALAMEGAHAIGELPPDSGPLG
jgi:Arc/MetJ family transcription regulator